MPDTVASRPHGWPLIAAAVAVVLMLGGTIGLWAHYGSTVFFETIRAGLAACFG
jgi:hypothetical protein